MLAKVCTIMPNYFETSHLILLITQQFSLALITRLWEKLQEGLLLYACSQAYSFLRNTEHSSMKGVSGKKNPTLQQNHKKPCHILLIWVMVQCGIGSLHGNIYIYIIYIYMYVCMYIYMHVHVYVCIYVYINMFPERLNI